MGTPATISIYEDNLHICTISRSADGAQAVAAVQYLTDNAVIICHTGDHENEFNIGRLSPTIVRDVMRGWETYTSLIPEITDVEIDKAPYALRIDIEGVDAWRDAGANSTWNGTVTVTYL